MRTVLVVAGLLAIGVVPLTAGAQHGETPAPAAHAAEASKPAAKAGRVPSATHDAKAAPPAKTAAKPVEPKKAAPKSDLEAAFDRIARKIEGAEVMPGGLRISSGSAAHAAEPRPGALRPAEPRAARPEATTTRIRLNWRSSVVWPAALDKADTPDLATASHESPRITLAWQ